VRYPLMMPLRRAIEQLMPIASGGWEPCTRAFDTTLEREVAVKLMKRGVAEDPKGLENFIHEARACGSLNHTNIIHIYTFDESDGERYLVMELADCGSLDNRIEREQRVSELDVLDIGIQVASALAAALKRNILHRDIKPAIFSSMRMATEADRFRPRPESRG